MRQKKKKKIKKKIKKPRETENLAKLGLKVWVFCIYTMLRCNDCRRRDP